MRSWVLVLAALGSVGCFESEEAPAAKTAEKLAETSKTRVAAAKTVVKTAKATQIERKTRPAAKTRKVTARKKLDAELFGKLTGDVKVAEVDTSVGKPTVRNAPAPRKSKGSTGKAGGAGTPQAVFEQAQTAMRRGDHRGFFETLTPGTQDLVAATMVIGSGFATMGKNGKQDPGKTKALEAILERHGVERGGPNINLSGGRKQVDAQMRRMLAGVRDRAGLYADLQSFMKRNAQNYRDRFTGGTLSDVVVKGDRATGKVRRNDGRSVPVAFLRSGGRWRMHIAR